ncbi:unnamed protein product, partial [Prunus brigantina]
DDGGSDFGSYKNIQFSAEVSGSKNRPRRPPRWCRRPGRDNFVNADLVINRANYDWWSFHDTNFIRQGILGDTLSKFSISGLHITFVLAVGRFIRLQCSDLRMRIPYENLPSCDR